MLEIEKTFLLKFIPKDLKKAEKIEIIDIYIPADATHPNLRLRKKGDKYEITRKVPQATDASLQIETTINLTAKEFKALKETKGKKLRKFRYLLKKKILAEIDLYQDDLAGLAMVDFEFENKQELNNFQAPDYCLADVSNEDDLAAGKLAGKKIKDIKEILKKFNYNLLRK